MCCTTCWTITHGLRFNTQIIPVLKIWSSLNPFIGTPNRNALLRWKKHCTIAVCVLKMCNLRSHKTQLAFQIRNFILSLMGFLAPPFLDYPTKRIVRFCAWLRSITFFQPCLPRWPFKLYFFSDERLYILTYTVSPLDT